MQINTRALAEAGLTLARDHLFAGDFGLGSGALAAGRWLALRDRPTGVLRIELSVS